MSSTQTNAPLVDFFIVGAMKAGTSSLRDMLRPHAEVQLYRGEIHYFDKETLYEQGPEWYHQHFDFSAGAKVIGDKSPSYSLDPGSPPLIKAYNPNAKVVWILRDPVKRTISNFHHAKKRNAEAMSLEGALQMAESLAARNAPAAYVYRSQYDRHIANYDAVFDRDQQYFMIFEELLKSPQEQINGLLDWLGVSSDVPLKLPHSNEGRSNIKRNNPVSDEIKAELTARLKPTVEAVEARLGRKIPSWTR